MFYPVHHVKPVNKSNGEEKAYRVHLPTDGSVQAEVHGKRTNAENTAKSVVSILRGAESDARVTQERLIDPELQAIIDAWPTLSEATKAEIKGVICGAGGVK